MEYTFHEKDYIRFAVDQFNTQIFLTIYYIPIQPAKLYLITDIQLSRFPTEEIKRLHVVNIVTCNVFNKCRAKLAASTITKD